VTAEVRRTDAPGVVTERVSCGVGAESAHERGVFTGSGRADLGRLPDGKHRVTVSLQPKGTGWAMPPPQEIDISVADDAR
jgi:hypothetical protein